MTDRPILFSSVMVRALLREIEAPGTGKTQTRRLAWRMKTDPCDHWRPTIWQSVKPGDRLYVQEHLDRSGGLVQYVANRKTSRHLWRAHWTKDWQPPRFCPKEFSRITLLVTATKREQVRDIDGIAALAEGVGREEGVAPWRLFCRLWKSLHTKPGARWEDNPEVVAITFRPVLSNIDQHEILDGEEAAMAPPEEAVE